MGHLLRLSLPTLALGLGVGCATTHPARAPASGSALPRATVDPASVHVEPLVFGEDDFAFVDGRTGEALAFEDVLSRARDAEVVLIGEQHDQPAHHRLQARVVRALGAREDRFAVGLEMVAWQYQGALDRFSAGEIDVDGVFDALDWQKTWGHDADLYRPIFEAGHSVRAQFVALNAPRELVRAVARKGLEGLSADERALLPELDLSDAVHRASIEAVFQHHHPPTGSGEAFDRFYAAQVLWDESMADRSVQALRGGTEQIVVLAGVGHVAGYRGIPQRIARRRPTTRMLSIVPLSTDTGDSADDVARVAIAEGEGDILAIRKPREMISL